MFFSNLPILINILSKFWRKKLDYLLWLVKISPIVLLPTLYLLNDLINGVRIDDRDYNKSKNYTLLCYNGQTK